MGRFAAMTGGSAAELRSEGGMAACLTPNELDAWLDDVIARGGDIARRQLADRAGIRRPTLYTGPWKKVNKKYDDYITRGAGASLAQPASRRSGPAPKTPQSSDVEALRAKVASQKLLIAAREESLLAYAARNEALERMLTQLTNDLASARTDGDAKAQTIARLRGVLSEYSARPDGDAAIAAEHVWRSAITVPNGPESA
jgi:hypothetical protein